jgi:peptidoglycan/LPS O-acetylase OafA/YrhL
MDSRRDGEVLYSRTGIHGQEARPLNPALQLVCLRSRAASEHARILALDGIRGLAILLVMAYHFTLPVGLSTKLESAVLAVLRQGWVGVELFFVLSGFLITGILVDSHPEPPRSRLWNFYARRVLRIFPLYYGAIAGICLLGLLIPVLRTPGYFRYLADQAWLWPYGVNVGQQLHGAAVFYYDWFDFTHFWTLAVEEHFYLIWPWVLLWPNRKGILMLCGILFLTILCLRASVIPVPPGWPYALTATPRAAGSLLIGAAVQVVMRGARGGRVLAVAAPWLGLASLGVFVAMKAADLPQSAWVEKVFGSTLLGVGFAGLIVYLVTRRQGVCNRLFESKTLRFFGKYSYGLYVFHHLLFPVWLKLFNVLQERIGVYRVAALAMIGIAAATSIGLSLISWRFFERPLLNLKRHFQYTNPLPATAVEHQTGGDSDASGTQDHGALALLPAVAVR